MSPKVFIIHGWDGYPEEAWFPWLKQELDSNGFQVFIPQMPNPAQPEIEAWVSHLTQIAPDIDEHTYFVGHSVGCQTIIRFLEKLPAKTKVAGVVFVAGWFTLTGLETDEERQIAQPWLETPIDFAKFKTHTDHITAIFSTNDKFVPKENQQLFREHLGAQIIVESDRGHFSEYDDAFELPLVLDTILSWN